MRLPISIKGVVSIKDPNCERDWGHIQRHVAHTLTAERANTVSYKNEIYFEVGWSRPLLCWKLLAPVSTGRISFKSENDQYFITFKLTFGKLFIITAALLILFVLLTINDFNSAPFKLAFLVLGWLCVVGVNILITAFRFSQFIKNCAAQVLGFYLVFPGARDLPVKYN